MKTKKVEVLPYNDAWPAEFEKIRGLLTAALGPCALKIEHVGSTSVPGLWAKPILDIDVVILDLTMFPEARRRLSAAAYRHDGDLGIPGREAFRYEGEIQLPRHHLYLCARDAAELQRHLALRDYLRSHPDTAREYSRVKREGAALHPFDIDAYILHKEPFILNIYRFCGL